MIMKVNARIMAQCIGSLKKMQLVLEEREEDLSRKAEREILNKLGIMTDMIGDIDELLQELEEKKGKEKLCARQ